MMVVERGHNVYIEREKMGRERIPKVRDTMDLVIQGVYLFIFFLLFFISFLFFLILPWE